MHGPIAAHLPRLFVASAVFSFLNSSAALTAEPTEAPAKIEFNRDIRPILSDHCFACHGPDAKHREADLRVDTEAGLLGTESEPGPVVKGNVDESELWRRIVSDDAEELMPPPKFAKPLSEAQRDLLRKWIEQGAEWQGHWAFQPVHAPSPPETSKQASNDGKFYVNEIDAFTARVLNAEGLAPAPAADRRILARRLSFDLLGLPPSTELVQHFVQDASPDAYEHLVDDLLASPHFGERLAMWWLDLVRYADSVGYHGDQPMSVSPYRDYVINAFNNNKPFDQFTVEQLAGDLLPNPTTEQLVASGYNRLGMMSAEGGVQPKEYLAKYIAERVRNLGGTWLGVTLGCCECHDHKYDPFSAQEFYQFEAFFADIEEQGLYAGSKWGSEMPVPTADQAAKQRELEAKIAEVQKVLDAPTDALAKSQMEWEASRTKWLTLTPVKAESLAGVTLSIQSDGAVLASGKNPATDTYKLEFDQVPEGITAIRIEVLPHESLPKKGPGRAGNGNFVLSELRVSTSRSSDASGSESSAEKSIALKNATASYEQTGAAGENPYKKWAVAAAIDQDAKGKTWGWAVMEQVGKANIAIFETSERVGGGNERLVLRLDQNLDNPHHTLGHFRVSVTTTPQPVTVQTELSVELAAIVDKPSAERSIEEAQRLAAHYRSLAPALEPQRKQLADLQKQLDALNQTVETTLVTKSVQPRMVRVLNRGNWMDETGKVVDPAFPAVLGGTPDVGRRLNRVDLANWVVNRNNPLTARVTVNRLWKLFFGAGLSVRLDDLGSQGQWPSHPDLLDWLAQHFMESGWNVKQLVKTMVMSGTYRQASEADSQLLERDPFNRLLARQARFRLDAEIIRDNALAVSGLLVDDVGGKSVNPYQPPGYWAYLNFPQREWKNGTNHELYRRGLYTHWQRQYLHPSLLAFDAPSREECTADRPRSNTPLQALVLLNDPSYIEAARVLAERVLAVNANEDSARFDWMMQTVLNRSPRPEETEVLKSLLEDHRNQYRSDVESARKLLAVGDKAIDARFDAAELAAWTSVTRAILNLHETITRN